MQQILIRHGESLSNQEGRVQGQADIDLSDAGRQQAEAVAAWCREQPWVADGCELWSSPLRRARETATAIAAATGLSVQVAGSVGSMAPPPE